MSSGLPEPPLTMASSVPAIDTFSSVKFATDYFSALCSRVPVTRIEGILDAGILRQVEKNENKLWRTKRFRPPERSQLRAVAKQTSGRGAGLLAVGHGDFAVNDDVLVALGLLHATPFAAGEIVNGFDRTHLEIFVIVNHDVGGRPDAERAAVTETGAHRGQRAEPPVGFFER